MYRIVPFRLCPSRRVWQSLGHTVLARAMVCHVRQSYSVQRTACQLASLVRAGSRRHYWPRTKTETGSASLDHNRIALSSWPIAAVRLSIVTSGSPGFGLGLRLGLRLTNTG